MSTPCGTARAVDLAMPKSASLGMSAAPSWSRMFDGLMSRWTMPAACASPSAPAIGSMTVSVAATLKAPPFADALVQGAAGDPFGDLEGQRRLALQEAEIVDAHGVGVRQARERERLLHEVIVAGRVGGRGAGLEAVEHLDAHRAQEALIEAAIDHAHAAVGDHFLDEVAIEERRGDEVEPIGCAGRVTASRTFTGASRLTRNRR